MFQQRAQVPVPEWVPEWAQALARVPERARELERVQALEREHDLLEGRSKQMLTKAQTQGRYGW